MIAPLLLETQPGVAHLCGGREGGCRVAPWDAAGGGGGMLGERGPGLRLHLEVRALHGGLLLPVCCGRHRGVREEKETEQVSQAEG